MKKQRNLADNLVLPANLQEKQNLKKLLEIRGKNAINIGVDVRLNTPFSAEVLEEVKPDEVIVAMGAVPFALPIPGADGKHVYSGMGHPYRKIYC